MKIIIEDYNKEHREEYFAIEALFRFTKDKNGHTDQELVDEYTPRFIRLAENGSDVLEVKKKISDEYKYQFFPLPTLVKQQRSAIYSQGNAGSGKTYTFTLFSKLFKMLNPNHRILYFTMNNQDLDRSLKKDEQLYEFIPMQKFCEGLLEVSKDMDALKESAKLFENCLLIFDDLSKLKQNKKFERAFYLFIDSSLEDMRKLHTSVFLIGHTSRLGQNGKIVREEMTEYIIYPQSIQTQNDRILESVFGWKPYVIENLFDMDTSRFMCINCKKRVITTPNQIFTVAYIKRKE